MQAVQIGHRRSAASDILAYCIGNVLLCGFLGIYIAAMAFWTPVLSSTASWVSATMSYHESCAICLTFFSSRRGKAKQMSDSWGKSEEKTLKGLTALWAEKQPESPVLSLWDPAWPSCWMHDGGAQGRQREWERVSSVANGPSQYVGSGAPNSCRQRGCLWSALRVVAF